MVCRRFTCREVVTSSMLGQADTLEFRSEPMWGQSLEAGKTGQQYTLITVLLATALFFSGTAPRFEVPIKRRIVLALGLAALSIAVGMFITIRRPSPETGASLKAFPEGNR